jgi:hypothetical protein
MNRDDFWDSTYECVKCVNSPCGSDCEHLCEEHLEMWDSMEATPIYITEESKE